VKCVTTPVKSEIFSKENASLLFDWKRSVFLFEAISKVIQKMAKMASQRTAKGSLKLLPAG
jgi:hypothetical protein